MSIERRQANSSEMKKNIKVVKQMTRGMSFDENMGNIKWSRVRKISNFGYQFMPKEKNVSFHITKLAGVKCLMTTPKNITSNHIIFYIHGGGFVSGGVKASKGFCSMLASYSGCRVIACEYSLAPEKPYPQGVDDCYNVYREIFKEYHGKVAIIGESAGANLSLVTTLKAKKNNIEMPACIVVHSPIIDFSMLLDRAAQKVDDFTVKLGCLPILKEMYCGEENCRKYDVSPIYGDYHEFPPLYITCDSKETLRVDAQELYNKVKDAGGKVKLIIMEDTFHAFATIGTKAPETKYILEETVNLIKKYFK